MQPPQRSCPPASVKRGDEGQRARTRPVSGDGRKVLLTPADLDRRIRQLHVSLDAVATEDLSSVVHRQGIDGDRFYSIVDFNEGVDDAQLMNVVEKLVENIACLRDHLDVWLKQNRLPPVGNSVINNNRSVALVHDLWNTQKHAELSKPPRSGIRPALMNVKRFARLTTGPGPSSVMMTLGLGGRPVFHATGSGKASLMIDGEIHDEHGNRVAEFHETCVEAVDHWEAALVRAGVTLPPR